MKGDLTDRGTEPDPRFSLANERTSLAWIRTSLALLAAGVALHALQIPISDHIRFAAGLILTIMGIGAAVQAWTGWMRAERALRENRPLPAPLLSGAIAPGVIAAGVIVGVGVTVSVGNTSVGGTGHDAPLGRSSSSRIELLLSCSSKVPVGATSVHLVCGVFGTICVGLFATPDRIARSGNTEQKAGLFYGGGSEQLIDQLIGIGCTAGYVLVTAFIAWAILKATMGIRVSEVEETEGLDLGEHGNEAYHGFVLSDS